ncbi:hypothetical protein [Halalkalibacterium halodurans]|uniref:Uncharacterized protein n=1 Tax=Halalkalibacterium halodurans TaxID=86665 RepID=A0A0M0KMS7_ALKHA|nr:hypothetical protein [Halalkalibacterium halodurans]TPE70648.1 hypothetical protein AMD02_001375 [Halalkalibacterium halodurans]
MTTLKDYRIDMRRILRRCSREELLTIWFKHHKWSGENAFKMEQAKRKMANVSDDELITKIIDRDIKEVSRG